MKVEEVGHRPSPPVTSRSSTSASRPSGSLVCHPVSRPDLGTGADRVGRARWAPRRDPRPPCPAPLSALLTSAVLRPTSPPSASLSPSVPPSRMSAGRSPPTSTSSGTGSPVSSPAEPRHRSHPRRRRPLRGGTTSRHPPRAQRRAGCRRRRRRAGRSRGRGGRRRARSCKPDHGGVQLPQVRGGRRRRQWPARSPRLGPARELPARGSARWRAPGGPEARSMSAITAMCPAHHPCGAPHAARRVPRPTPAW